MNITITEVNGRRYAYTCTSKHVPGKKNPVSVRTYLGKIDPKTGEIIPKKGSSSEDIALNSGFLVKSYGDVALIMSAIKDLSLRDDFRIIFGERGDDILAIAIAQAIHPTTSDALHLVMKQSFVCEMLGLDPSKFTAKHIRATINSISLTDMTNCFKQRYSRVGGLPLVYSNTTSLTEGSEDSLKRLHGIPVNDDVAIAIAMDKHGRPISFHLIHDPIQDDSDLLEFIESFKAYTGRCIFIADTTSAPNIRLPELLLRGIDVIAPFPSSSYQYLSAMETLENKTVPQHPICSDTRVMGDGIVGIQMNGRNYSIIHKTDKKFKECGMRMNAFLSYDPQSNLSAIIAMETIIRNTKSCLNGKQSKNPEADLNKLAGAISDLMNIRIQHDGTMKVTTKRSKVSDFKTKAGLSLVLSTIPWNDIVLARQFRKDMTQVFRQYYRGSHWLMEYIGKEVGMTSFKMIEFTVLMIYHEIYRILKNNGLSTDIQDALYLASSMKVVITPLGNFRSIPNHETKTIFNVFDIDIEDLPSIDEVLPLKRRPVHSGLLRQDQLKQ